MCPRFHSDRVLCRLITTYRGAATEWLHDGAVKRERLGTGSRSLPDGRSGLYRRATDVQRLDEGDVALLKGDAWEGNEGGGLIHRSPDARPGGARLLLTLDFSD